MRCVDAAPRCRSAAAGVSGYTARSQAAQAEQPPASWATTNAGTEAGAMPAKVSLNMRPTVTAGLAKLVDEVNQ